MSSHPFPHLADGVTSTVENVDGNALAGPLSALFAADLTTALVMCRHCGDEAPLATAVVERDDTADIVICRGCTHTLFTLHHSPAGLRLEVAGLAALASPSPSPAPSHG